MNELVFTGEDHSYFPLEFNLAEAVSLHSDSLRVSKVVVVNSYGRGPFLASFGRHCQEFTCEVHGFGLLEELVAISHFRHALLIGSVRVL